MSVYKPQHLSAAELDAVYTQLLKELEVMHLRACVNGRVIDRFGRGQWDTEQGEHLLQQVRDEWEDVKGSLTEG